MRAAVMRSGALLVDEVATPVPAAGQVLVETIACGICGSDLHCLRHARRFVEVSRETGLGVFDFDPDRDVVMGHEFSARVLAPGPGVTGWQGGEEIVAFPTIRTPAGVRAVGYSNDYPGGYAQQMVLDEASIRRIPNGLDPRLAALTEPMAVGLHAVNESRLGAGPAAAAGAVVLGCGPVGLAVIASLAHRGAPLVVAAELSPARRELAGRLGAHVVVDPREQPPVEAWRAAGGRGPLVIFEAVGVPGMLDLAMTAAPPASEIVVVGVCMEDDRIRPTVGINKRLSLRFVLGWSPAEFEESLAAIAEGRVDVSPLVTGEVSLDETPAAFAALGDPQGHAKILVRPNGFT
ncbi:MAG: zinc-binding dehydrogenase [Acidimicrobiales bacterium]